MKVELDLSDRDVRLLTVYGNINPNGPALIHANDARRLPAGVVATIGDIELLFGADVAARVAENATNPTHVIVRVLTVSDESLREVFDEIRKPQTPDQEGDPT